MISTKDGYLLDPEICRLFPGGNVRSACRIARFGLSPDWSHTLFNIDCIGNDAMAGNS